MRIESHKQAELGMTRAPRRRVDMQGNAGGMGFTVAHYRSGSTLAIHADVHAGASQEPRRACLAFTATETAQIRDALTRDLCAELAALREDVRAFVSDARHGLGPDVARLVRALERAP